MTDKTEMTRESDIDMGEKIYSNVVRAGKRTYFFDVKTTRGNDCYLTITESRKKTDKDGNVFFDKHKIHLYKEDFQKYADGLNDAVNYIRKNRPDIFEQTFESSNGFSIDEEFDKL